MRSKRIMRPEKCYYFQVGISKYDKVFSENPKRVIHEKSIFGKNIDARPFDSEWPMDYVQELNKDMKNG